MPSTTDATDATGHADVRRDLSKRQLRRRLRGLVAVLLVAWTLVATYLALLPDPPNGNFGDDLGHFAASMMLGLGALTVFRWWQRPWRAAIGWLLVAAALGGAVEAIQQSIGRSAERSDFVADMLGVAFALAMSTLLVDWRGRNRSGRSGLSNLGHGTVSLVMSVGLLIALAGPVWNSSPVALWRECRSSSSPDPDLEAVRLADLAGDAAFENATGTEVPTEVSSSRKGLEDTTALVAHIRCSGSFSAMATVTSGDLAQAGPTRIVASATGIQYAEQNFHLGQEEDGLSVRIRTRPNQMEWFVIDDVFVDRRPHHVAIRFDDGRAEIFVDGQLRESFVTAGRELDDWDDYPLSVGNEVTNNRAFVGSISEVEVVSTWLSDAEIEERAAGS